MLEAVPIVVDGLKMELVVELMTAIVDCDVRLIDPEVLAAAALEADDTIVVWVATLPGAVYDVERPIAAPELLAGGQ